MTCLVTGAAVFAGSGPAALLEGREDYAWMIVDGNYAVLMTVDGATDPDNAADPRIGFPLPPQTSFYINKAMLEKARFVCEDADQSTVLQVQGGGFSY
jgi:hypothetical protein